MDITLVKTKEFRDTRPPGSARIGPVEPREDGYVFAVFGPEGEPLLEFSFAEPKEAEAAHGTLATLIQNGTLAAGTPPPAPVPAAVHNAFTSVGDQTWRQRIYALLEEGMMESRLGRLIETALVALIVFNVVAVALESVPSIYGRFHAAFGAFEQVSLAAFTVEYFLRLWVSVEDPRIAARGPFRGRVAFALRPLVVVDFLAFAPSYLGIFLGIDLRVLRIFRLFRLLKLARYSQALQALLGVLLAERNALFASVVLLLSTMCLEGEMMHLAEGGIQPRTLGTLPGAMYWALTTLTTVGYGDITPVTVLGKFIAAVTMVTGLALFALPIGIIAHGFVTGLSRRRFPVTWNMLRRQPLFQGLDVQALNEVLESATASLIKEHAQITNAGREATEFYLIISGLARSESDSGMHDLGPGEMIGQETLHYSAEYSTTATAKTAMRVLALPADELRRLSRKYPLLQARIAGSLTTKQGAPVSKTVRLRQLEAENARLRRLLVDRTLEKLAVTEQLT